MGEREDWSTFGKRLAWALAFAKKERKDLQPVLRSSSGDMGVSSAAVGQVLNGTGKMTAENCLRAAAFCGVDPFWLATGEGSPEGAAPHSRNVDVELRRADGTRVLIEVKTPSKAPDTLTTGEVQKLIEAILAIPLSRAREIVAHVALDAKLVTSRRHYFELLDLPQEDSGPGDSPTLAPVVAIPERANKPMRESSNPWRSKSAPPSKGKSGKGR